MAYQPDTEIPELQKVYHPDQMDKILAASHSTTPKPTMPQPTILTPTVTYDFGYEIQAYQDPTQANSTLYKKSLIMIKGILQGAGLATISILILVLTYLIIKKLLEKALPEIRYFLAVRLGFQLNKETYGSGEIYRPNPENCHYDDICSRYYSDIESQRKEIEILSAVPTIISQGVSRNCSSTQNPAPLPPSQGICHNESSFLRNDQNYSIFDNVISESETDPNLADMSQISTDTGFNTSFTAQIPEGEDAHIFQADQSPKNKKMKQGLSSNGFQVERKERVTFPNHTMSNQSSGSSLTTVSQSCVKLSSRNDTIGTIFHGDKNYGLQQNAGQAALVTTQNTCTQIRPTCTNETPKYLTKDQLISILSEEFNKNRVSIFNELENKIQKYNHNVQGLVYEEIQKNFENLEKNCLNQLAVDLNYDSIF